jgi:hypothetical protein
LFYLHAVIIRSDTHGGKYFVGTAPRPEKYKAASFAIFSNATKELMPDLSFGSVASLRNINSLGVKRWLTLRRANTKRDGGSICRCFSELLRA